MCFPASTAPGNPKSLGLMSYTQLDPKRPAILVSSLERQRGSCCRGNGRDIAEIGYIADRAGLLKKL